MNRLVFALSTILLACCGRAHAASLALQYTGSHTIARDGAIIASVGDLITLDLVMDFSGIGETTIGGSFDIVFDEAAFEFVEYTGAGLGTPEFYRDPDVQDGVLSSASFGSFAGLTGPSLVASMSFLIDNVPPGEYIIAPAESAGLDAPFISAIDFITPIEPEFIGVQVRVIPLPAAAWLFGGALLMLTGLQRRP